MDKYAKLYRDNAKYVYNVALGILRNKADAEDIAQAVFVKLFESLDSFRGDSDIKTYLYRMAMNRSIDLIRSRKIREKHMENAYKPGKQQDIEGSTTLTALLETLETDYKAPLLLSEVGGLTYREISDALGINIGTVKSRINRAIEKLKKTAKG